MKNWYAVYTKSGCEKKVADLLSKKNFETYCPTKGSNTSGSWWNIKKSGEPVFTSRIFVKASEQKISEVRKCSGVINILYWREVPAIINENEIDSIRYFLSQNENFSIQKTAIQYNQSNTGNVITMKNYTAAGLRNASKVDIPTLGVRLCATTAHSDTGVFSIKTAPCINLHAVTAHRAAM